MRVAFGVTVLENGRMSRGIDGIGRYTQELCATLARRGSVTVEPFCYAPARTDLSVGRFSSQALWSLASGRPFPIMQRKLVGKVDLVHATDHYVPRLRGLPVVATIMDAIPLAHPEWVVYRFKTLKHSLWARSVRWASHFITISEHSSQQIQELFRVPAERISVVPLGVDRRWFTLCSARDAARVKLHYRLPERFFVFIGTLQPRKNLVRIIRAHQSLPTSMQRDVPLLIVGRQGWGCDAELALLRNADPQRLRWLDYVAEPDLKPLLQQSIALVFPSLYEGFGLPVLEAFGAGVPVLSSNTTSLPEVAGRAALLVDPLSQDAIAAGMRDFVENEFLRASLVTAGRIRAERFTWERTAAMTEAVYETLL
jgi:glycosyltransferase involved in cell wall biosynthesis